MIDFYRGEIYSRQLASVNRVGTDPTCVLRHVATPLDTLDLQEHPVTLNCAL